MCIVSFFNKLPFTTDWQGKIKKDPNVVHVDWNVHNILGAIKNGIFDDKISQLRKLYTTDKPKYDNLKKQLPFVMFTGIFTEYSTSGLVATSGLACLDFDKIPASEYSDVWNQVIFDPYTFAAFRSPSGNGIKALVKLDNDTDKTSHKEYVEALKDHFNSPYWDPTCNQLVRGCFISSDPDCYVNDNALIWTKRPFAIIPMFNPSPTSTTWIPLTTAEEQKALNTMEGGWKKWAPMTPGSRHNSSFLRAREMAEHGISQDYTHEYMSQFVDDTFSEYECNKCVREAYEKTKEKGKVGTKKFKYKKP